jgi:hypothetical protein
MSGLKPVSATLVLLLGAAGTTPPRVLDTRWTRAAEERYYAQPEAKKLGVGTALPHFLVYDARGRLILDIRGGTIGHMGADLDAAIRRGRTVAGPALSGVLRDLETRDGRPAVRSLGRAKTTVVDYWAEWCVPCKTLGKEIDVWAAGQPAGAIQIVRAETDMMAVERRHGGKTYKVTKGPHGEQIKTEMK